MMTINSNLPTPNGFWNSTEGKLIQIISAIGLFIFLFSTISGCSPAHKLAKLQKQHPELFQAKIITTIHHDTLTTKEIHKDSVINNIYSKDTVYIKEGRETVKYVYMTGSKAYISGSVAADTIIKIDTVKSKETTIVKQVKAPKDGWEWLQFWLTIAVLAFVIGKYGGPYILKLLRFIPHFPF